MVRAATPLRPAPYRPCETDPAMRSEALHSILSDLNGSTTDIEASAVLSTDGLIMASMLPGGMDEDRVGAMSATMLSLGERISTELGRGNLEQVLIRGETGYVLMTHAGNEAVVTVIAKPESRLGLIFLDVRRAAESIARLL